MDICQFTTSNQSGTLDNFLSVSFEGVVTVWSFVQRRRLVSFPTCYDYGGKRMAQAAGLPLMLAASFKRGLVEQYDVNGDPMWGCFIEQPQRISWIQSQQCWCIATGNNVTHLIDEEGRELARLSDTVLLIALDGEYSLAVRENTLHLLGPGLRELWHFPKHGFGVLDAVRYTSDKIAIAYAGGRLDSISVSTATVDQITVPKGLPQCLAATSRHELYALVDVPGEARVLMRATNDGFLACELMTLPWQSGRGMFAQSGEYFLSRHTGIWKIDGASLEWSFANS